MRPSPSPLLVQELPFILSAASCHPQFLLGVVAATTAAQPLSCSRICRTAQNSNCHLAVQPLGEIAATLACHCSTTLACHHCSATFACHHCSAALLCHHCSATLACHHCSAALVRHHWGAGLTCHHCRAALFCRHLQRSPPLPPQQRRPSAATTAARPYDFDVYAHQRTDVMLPVQM